MNIHVETWTISILIFKHEKIQQNNPSVKNIFQKRSNLIEDIYNLCSTLKENTQNKLLPTSPSKTSQEMESIS